MHEKPPRKTRSDIVAGGLLSPLSKEYAATRGRLITAARVRYAHETENATILGRMRLELKIQREVRAELRKKFPPGALYAVPQPPSRA
jgi:hypothetical protein